MTKKSQFTLDTAPAVTDYVDGTKNPGGTPVTRNWTYQVVRDLFLREAGGTSLAFGTITDGQFLKRSGTLITSTSVIGVATDPIWQVKGDLAVGTAGTAAARLAAGADFLTTLTADSAQSVGLRWMTTAILKSTPGTMTSNSTLANDSELAFAIAANEKWIADLWLVVTSGTTGTDFKYAFTIPTGGSMYQGPIASTQSVTASWLAVESAGAPKGIGATSGGAIAFGSDNLTWGVGIHAIFMNGTTAGTVNFQWAQNTSGTSPTVLQANSHMLIRRLA